MHPSTDLVRLDSAETFYFERNEINYVDEIAISPTREPISAIELSVSAEYSSSWASMAWRSIIAKSSKPRRAAM